MLASFSVSTNTLVDPTRPANYQQPTTEQPSLLLANAKPKWILNSTFVHPYKQMAIINGVQLYIGDEVEGAMLMEIKHEQVILALDGITFSLELDKSFIDYIK
jgi:hypothetical protein